MPDAPAPARARLAVDERRAQLIALGVQLFSERSYDDISIDDIAQTAGVSKGLLYHYFGSKRAFYAACVEHAAQDLLTRLAAVPETMAPEATGAEHARAGLDAYFDFVQEHAGAYVALMKSGIGNDPEITRALDLARAVIVERLFAGVGLEPPRPLYQVAVRSWVGQVETACLAWLETREVPRATLVHLLMGSLWSTLTLCSALNPDPRLELDAPPPGFFG